MSENDDLKEESSEENGLERDNAQDADSANQSQLKAKQEKAPQDKKSVKIACGIGAAVVVIAVVALFATHVICFHEWEPATCDKPETCSICGKTRGEATGHTWTEATCEKPETCSVCGAKKLNALGHDYEGLSCTADGVCTRCGKVEPALGHSWEDATCTEPKTCSRCGVTEGEPSDSAHSWIEATCTEAKTCSRCGAIEGEALGHTTDNGVCDRCGEEHYATVSGSGDRAISDITTGDGIYRIHFTNNGSSNFAVWLYDSTGDKDLLINTIGSYDGYTLLSGSEPYTLEITSSGSWSYSIERLVSTNETSFSGTGDFVTNLFKASSGTWRFTHDGSSNFAVWVYTTSGKDLLVNTIGSYDGTKVVSIPSGSSVYIEISADGTWSASPE